MIDGNLVKWLKNDGERIVIGDPIATVMSNKVSFDIVAGDSGILRTISSPGEVVPVGKVVGYMLENENDPIPFESGMSFTGAGSGKSAPLTEAGGLRAEIKATPVARRLAKENGLELAEVKGTGPGGRITEEDILREVSERKDTSQPSPTKGSASGKEVQRIPFVGLRRQIANNLVESLQSMAQVTAMTEADVSGLIELRQSLKGTLKLSYTDILVKIIAMALRRHPVLNATVAGDEILLLNEVNVGVAVAVEGGLIVPVIRQADTLSLSEIASTTLRLIENVRQGTFSLEDVTGGTFTITNVGMYGLDGFTPIINPPEVAILGVGRIVERPVVEAGQIVIRPMMNLGLTFDHRVMDGAPAAEFLTTIKEYLANPYLLL